MRLFRESRLSPEHEAILISGLTRTKPEPIKAKGWREPRNELGAAWLKRRGKR